MVEIAILELPLEYQSSPPVIERAIENNFLADAPQGRRARLSIGAYSIWGLSRRGPPLPYLVSVAVHLPPPLHQPAPTPVADFAAYPWDSANLFSSPYLLPPAKSRAPSRILHLQLWCKKRVPFFRRASRCFRFANIYI